MSDGIHRVVTEAEGDEPRLVDAALGGDRVALATLLDRHSGQVRAMIHDLVGARGPVDDLLQEARLRVVRGISSFERRARFATWFSRIGVNLAVSELRKRRTQEALPVALAGGDDPGRDAERVELRERMAAALDRLPPAQREAFDLAYRDGLDSTEIGARLGLPAATVRTRIFHARRRLREALDAYLSD